jgi:Protein of unknown function (DUF3089)
MILRIQMSQLGGLMFRHSNTAIAMLCAGALVSFVFAGTATPQTQEPSKAPSAAAAPTPAQTQASPKNDYSNGDNWLCRPGHQDSCAVDISSTVISPDGKLTIESWSSNPNAPIDCFYVYPTVSDQPTPNADMTLDPSEKRVVRAQFERFGSQCRLFAPLYRQVTLMDLKALITGSLLNADRALPYNDVADAWHYYLEHDNHGRGVILIGHSQGSNVLIKLIRNEIDGQPVQSRMISALLLGATVPVPRGKDVGGAFQHVPLCHSASQTGCVITYAAFRASAPPPDNSFFARVKDDAMMAACTNPAALAGGSGELHSYLPTVRSGHIADVSNEQRPWLTPRQPINTPFVSLPGMLTAECVSNEHGSYLAVTVHADPAGPRVSDIPGDVIYNGQLLPEWGLHLIDVNLTMGNLIDIFSQQSKAYLASNHKK